MQRRTKKPTKLQYITAIHTNYNRQIQQIIENPMHPEVDLGWIAALEAKKAENLRNIEKFFEQNPDRC